ncbi:mediator of RNA polymerase II transcription subunit 29-like [Haliotis cracherodii]|uniref:mediator of RNA polymerase II transcription subunit 29-like n=1 Tax=Haliotis rufescens TaxID=6454 RepID=UPI001EAF90EE|nr:mediator of RNA polymerase II transcription subunit 29-like [Haliotis rufescens]
MAAPVATAGVSHMSQGQPQQQPQPPQPPQQPTDVDPVAKFKSLLLPRLKESLATLFKVAGQAFNQNAQQDSGFKPAEGHQQKFEKSLEEFYGVCDQVEVSLRLALESQSQVSDSNKFTPQPVLQAKGDTPPTEGQLYPNYLATIRSQITCAKEVHDMLHECVRKLSERP